MEEETKVDTQEETTETADSLNSEEVVEKSTDDPYASKTVEDYKDLERKNKELYERAKKAEALAKAKKEAVLKKETNETPSTLTREEAILYAKGYTDEEVDLANKLAKVNGTTILKSIEDEIFKVKYESRLKKERSEKASLSPSGGSGRFKSEKNPGEMTREEHEAYYKKVMGV